MKRTLSILFTGFVFCFSAQTEISVMCYNTLTYPQGSIADRNDTLKKILEYSLPDLVLLQELKSEAGFLELLDVFNSFPNSQYEAGTYVPQISNPSNDWRLQQNILYNYAIFRLAHEEVIETNYRDINYFKLYLFDALLDEGADTTFVYVYNTHLKSSQGFNNEQLRLQMAEVMIDHIDNLPENSYVIAGGDFNVYTSDEPAYQELLQTTSNTLFDPIDMPGNWTDFSFPNKEILTQSTRASNIGDGAGGGMDDRFDFMLLSEALMNAGSDISFQENSYQALGNNGTCYNSSITACLNDNDVPISVLRALFYMSDHLPVLLSLNTSITLNNKDLSDIPFRIYPNPFEEQLNIQVETQAPFKYELFDAKGRLLENGWTPQSLDLSHLNPGLYTIVFLMKDRLFYQKLMKI